MPREHHGEPGRVGGARSPRRRASSRRAGSPRWRRPRRRPAGRRRRGRRRRRPRRSPWPGSRRGRRPSRPRRPSRRRCARNRPGSSARRRCRPWRRPGHRRWRSTSRAWRPGRRSAGRRAPARWARACVTTCRSMASTTALSRPCARKPPATVRRVRPGCARVRQAAGQQQAQVLLGGDDGDRPPRSRRAR